MMEELAEPAWEIASLFPTQGNWSEDEYLALDTNHLVEFSDGRVEVLPMPSDRHQAIVTFFLLAFVTYAKKAGGIVRPAPLRVRLWPGKVREPDVVFLLAEHDAWRHEEYWEGADVVVEVVSGSSQDRRRDLVTKRQEYAQAGISEYWIVDPDRATITVLTLVGSEYGEHGRFTRNEVATSRHLPGFWVAVNEALDAI
jgi:Uma2 family endonuclease